MTGHWAAGAVKRELGWAALRPQSGVHSFPSQSMALAGAGTPMSSHQTSPSGVRATLVKMVLRVTVAMALGFDCFEVPGATPKNPRFRVHGIEAAILAQPDPGDVVADAA